MKVEGGGVGLYRRGASLVGMIPYHFFHLIFFFFFFFLFLFKCLGYVEREKINIIADVIIQATQVCMYVYGLA